MPDLPSLLRKHFGVDVSLEPLPADIHGLFITDPDAAVPGTDQPVSLMLVNTSDTYGRQRFTSAHELAHLLFGDAELLVDYKNDGSVPEKRANAFASAFLLPLWDGCILCILGEGPKRHRRGPPAVGGAMPRRRIAAFWREP